MRGGSASWRLPSKDPPLCSVSTESGAFSWSRNETAARQMLHAASSQLAQTDCTKREMCVCHNKSTEGSFTESSWFQFERSREGSFLQLLSSVTGLRNILPSLCSSHPHTHTDMMHFTIIVFLFSQCHQNIYRNDLESHEATSGHGDVTVGLFACFIHVYLRMNYAELLESVKS